MELRVQGNEGNYTSKDGMPEKRKLPETGESQQFPVKYPGEYCLVHTCEESTLAKERTTQTN